MEQPGRDGVGINDGAGRRTCSGRVHVDGAIRGDGVRGDGVGVGDVGAVSSRKRSKRDSSGSGDTREQIGDRKHGDIIGRRNTQ